MEKCYVARVSLDAGILQEDAYFAHLPVVRNLHTVKSLSFSRPVTFLVGENGVGKSTLLEAIAVSFGFNPEGGTVNFDFSSQETHSGLHNYIQLTKSPLRPKDGFFLRAESFYNVATEVDRLSAIPAESTPTVYSYGGTSLHAQSHGESFMALVLNRFGGNGLYILDEPEAALSPSRQMSLLVAIHQLVQNNSQVIISTHSPILMAYPNAEIFELTEEKIAKTSYQETGHYMLSHRFLNDYKNMLAQLLEEEQGG